MGSLTGINEWGFVSQERGRPDRAAFLLPEPDDVLVVAQRVELVDAEVSVAQFPVEGLN